MRTFSVLQVLPLLVPSTIVLAVASTDVRVLTRYEHVYGALLEIHIHALLEI
eukprot:jgi/Botrbrau1/14097/Bobra.182_3s0042.1